MKLPNVLKTKGDIAADTGLEINFPFTTLIWSVMGGEIRAALTCKPCSDELYLPPWVDPA